METSSMFKATHAWQEIISQFRHGVPQRRHLLHMKRHNDCFTGMEAAHWLLNNLKTDKLKSDSCQLSRQQAVKLLEMCVKFDVIEDVRGGANTTTVFHDDRKHLYHFVTGRPTLFGDSTNCDTTGSTTNDKTERPEDQSLCITNRNFLQSPAVAGRKRRRVLGEIDTNQMSRKPVTSLPQSVVAKVWQEHIIARLLQLVDLPMLDMLRSHDLSSCDLTELMTPSNKKQCLAISCDLPQNVLTAMKYLENFTPQSMCDGFEQVVWSKLSDYLLHLKEPIIPSSLYELHVAVGNLVTRGMAGGLNSALEATQLCCLLLSKTARVTLQTLLKFMWSVCHNQELELDTEVVSTLYPVILRPNKGKPSDKTDSNHPIIKTLVWFMMDHHSELFNVPSQLSDEVEHHLTSLHSTDKSCDTSLCRSHCKQVSRSEYTSQMKETSHLAIVSLLDEITTNQTMSHHKKKQLLKKFQQQYPEVYASKFAA